MELPQRVWVENTVCRVETYWLSSKEKFPGAGTSKEMMLSFEL